MVAKKRDIAGPPELLTSGGNYRLRYPGGSTETVGELEAWRIWYAPFASGWDDVDDIEAELGRYDK